MKPTKSATRKRAPAKRRAAPRKKGSGFTMGWANFLWVLAMVNLIAGLIFSPVTGLHHVSVKGADSAVELKAIKKRLEPWATEPWIRQSRSAMATAVLADNRLSRVTISSNVFGRGELTLVHREPVAKIEPPASDDPEKVADSAIYLDSTGVLYRDSNSIVFQGPVLVVPDGARVPQMSVIQTWPLNAVAKVSVKGQGLLQELQFKVVLDERSVISLEVADGPQIILGPESDLDEKFSVLSRAFASDKDKIMGYKLINVSAPDRPVFSP
ncbi:MAG: cell division protein FtsQ/DivIB [Fimbriimonadaceae bacterium]